MKKTQNCDDRKIASYKPLAHKSSFKYRPKNVFLIEDPFFLFLKILFPCHVLGFWYYSLHLFNFIYPLTNYCSFNLVTFVF